MSADTDAIDEVLLDISRIVGIYAYGAYKDDGKRLIGEAIVGAVALALLKDYISGFIDLKAVGKAHREYLRELLRKLAADDAPASQDLPAIAAELTVPLQTAAALPDSDTRRAAARQHLETSLTQLGTSAEVAATMAADIDRAAQPLITGAAGNG